MKDSGALTEGYIVKGGHNDLWRWKRFGGTLERPSPPAPIYAKRTVAAPATEEDARA